MAAFTVLHTEPAVGRQSLFQGYHCPAEAYDEAFAVPGLPRPYWERVVQMLDSLGVEELT